MKLITLLLTSVLALTTVLPAQSKKEGAKKAKEAVEEGKKATAEAKGEAKKAVAETKGEGKKAMGDAGKAVAAKKAESKDLPAQAERCQAQTQDGDQCKRKAGDGSKFCWQHAASKKGAAKAAKKKAA